MAGRSIGLCLLIALSLLCALCRGSLPTSSASVQLPSAPAGEGGGAGAQPGDGARRWRNRSPRQQQQQQQTQQQQQQQQQEQLPKVDAPGAAATIPPSSSTSSSPSFSPPGSVPPSAPPSDAKSEHETTFVAECLMPTSLGRFRMRSYRYHRHQQQQQQPATMEPVVVIHGDVSGAEDVVVRVHDQCFTSEVFGSRRCDCREQLHESLKLIRRETGLVIYLQQEGRGIGISNKVAAYSLQDNLGVDTVDANLHLGFPDELREYRCVPDILRDLGVRSIRLVTNNPYKIDQLTALGVIISDRVSLSTPPNEHNIGYIRSKRDRMQHLFPLDLAAPAAAAGGAEGGGVGGVGGGGGGKEASAGSASSAFERFFRDSAAAAAAAAAARSRGLGGDDKGAAAAGEGQGGGASEGGVKGGDHYQQQQQQQQQQEEPATRPGYAFGRQSIVDAIAAVRAGGVVVVVDDENRENEGDLIMAAELATPETIGFIVRFTSGVLCAGMEGDRLDSLLLPPMVQNNEDPKKTAYTVSVDCRHGTTTGISASDRAMTFRALADPSFHAQDFQRPGHVFPLRYRPGGVLVRAGHTEASVDLARLAGLKPAGVLAEVVNDDGSIMRLPGLRALASEHGLVLTSVQDLVAFRVETESAAGAAAGAGAGAGARAGAGQQ